MSRIDNLIAELCPAGVPFKTLKDVVEVRSGWGFPNNDQGQPAGAFPFYKVSDMNLSGNEQSMTTAKNYIDETSARKLGVELAPPGTVIFPKIGAAVATNKKRLLSTYSAYDNNVMGLIPTNHLQPKFLLYWMQTFNLTSISNDSGAVPSIRKSKIECVRIPVPPLEVQREIVRMLDTFTELEADLASKLEEELEARRQQYGYYRDALLSFDVHMTGARKQHRFRWATLGEMGSLTRGRRFTKEDYVLNGIGCIHYGDIYTQYGTSATKTASHVRADMAFTLRFAKPGDVIIAAVGETVEDVGKAVAWLGADEVAVHDDCFTFRHSMDPKFVSYYFQSKAFHAEKNKFVARAKVKRLSGKDLAKLAVPVPPLDEQQRIVAILDRFDALVNDLFIGLSAELEARRRQYVHYRDRLLSFPGAS